MAETFKLPASSFEEIIKIIQAYANEREGTLLSLDNISQSTGVPRTGVSGNNGFLVQVGLITEGNKKAATDIGRNLGRAYISKVEYEIERIWKEIIIENEFLSRMVSAVRIRNGMDRTSFFNHIIYSSGQKDTKQNRTGAGAIIEMLKSIGVLIESDGKLIVAENNVLLEKERQEKYDASQNENQESEDNSVSLMTLKKGSLVTINININCSVAEMDDLSEKLKMLLKEL